MKKDNYMCPRCGYESHDRSRMRRHFFEAKKKCPASRKDIELTEEVKSYILENRIYHFPEQVSCSNAPHQTFNQIINNYNTMNNFISSMDAMEKLSKYLNYRGSQLMDFERTVELKYEEQRINLEKDHGHHEITKDRIFEIIDQVTKIGADLNTSSSLEEFNVMYDSQLNKVLLYESGFWKEMIVATGLKTIIATIQEHFWDAYECHLIRRIHSSEQNAFQKSKIRDLLKEYYTFLACVDVDPYVKDRYDNQILYTSDDDRYFEEPDPHESRGFEIVDEYTKLYKELKENLTMRQRGSVKKDLLDMIKRNSKKNVTELNKAVMSLFKVDEEFKQTLMEASATSSLTF